MKELVDTEQIMRYGTGGANLLPEDWAITYYTNQECRDHGIDIQATTAQIIDPVRAPSWPNFILSDSGDSVPYYTWGIDYQNPIFHIWLPNHSLVPAECGRHQAAVVLSISGTGKTYFLCNGMTKEADMSTITAVILIPESVRHPSTNDYCLGTTAKRIHEFITQNNIKLI